MKLLKYLILAVLTLSQFQSICAEKRANPRPMNELTDPSSPSFVPYPYPKTREEIIADLIYGIKKYYTLRDRIYEIFFPGRLHITAAIKFNLLKNRPKYQIDDKILVFEKLQKKK